MGPEAADEGIVVREGSGIVQRDIEKRSPIRKKR
jgi:hypothetical protein